MNTGDLPGQANEAEVRAAIGSMNSGNAEGEKGGRKAKTSNEGGHEEQSLEVSEKNKQGEPRYGAEREIWSEKMLEALERGDKGNVWFSLIDKVYRTKTLELAWEKVRKNAGACGIDGMTVEHFGKDIQARLLAVSEQLKGGNYTPKPVKRVWINKAGSAQKRPLGIPAVRDRVVQSALKMVIEPIFEREFASQSYGFRPGCGCKDALRRVSELLEAGYVHVVDVDIRGYFDTIPHDRLMKLVREHIADGRVLGLIEGFLKQGVMEEIGEVAVPGEEGTPQGGVISPLLANLYLNPLDWQMHQEEIEMVRYADDMVLMCKDKESALRAHVQLEKWMTEAALTLHPEKTKIVDMAQAKAHFDFLGYRFWRGKTSGNIRKFIRPKSRKKIKDRIRLFTRRSNGYCMAAIIARVNPILRGVYNYFKHASSNSLQEIDGWVRGRLRSILRQRRKRKGIARGFDHQCWNNRYFATLGLLSLEQDHRVELFSLHHGVKR